MVDIGDDIGYSDELGFLREGPFLVVFEEYLPFSLGMLDNAVPHLMVRLSPCPSFSRIDHPEALLVMAETAG